MRILGIDPGKKGCFVLLDRDEKTAHYLAMPLLADRSIDFDQVYASLDLSNLNMIFLEKVLGRGSWGAANVWSFAENYGQLRAQILYKRPHTLVPPKTWQKIAHVGTEGDNAKIRSMQSFQRINPSTKVYKTQDGLIDAFHIARYGLISFRAKFTDDWRFIRL